MAQGQQVQSVEYILKTDQGAPKEEQTVWHIKLLTAMDNTRSVQRLSKAFKTGLKGDTDVDPEAYKRAIRANWNDAILKVENYMFGFRYPELQKDGYVTVEDDDIEKILEEIPRDWVDELMDVANGVTVLGKLDSKK